MEAQCNVTDIINSNYSLACKANETFIGDLQSAVSFIDENDILLVNFVEINQSNINIDIEKNKANGKIFYSKNSGLKPGIIAIIVTIPIVVIAFIISLIVYNKKNNKVRIDYSDTSNIKPINLSA